MIVKGINECDTVNYDDLAMFIAFPKCSFKCDVLNGCQVCQNSDLALMPNIDIPIDSICAKYINNPLTHALVCGGLEPFDSYDDLILLLDALRVKHNCNDTVIIYTGYTEDELYDAYMIQPLLKYHNIIIKFGRFIKECPHHIDPILNVELASPNQYAKVVSK